MNEPEERILRRTVKYLLDMEEKDAASLLLSARFDFSYDGSYSDANEDVEVIYIDIEVAAHTYKLLSDEQSELRRTIQDAFSYIVSLDDDMERSRPRTHKAHVFPKLRFADFDAADWRQEARHQLRSASKYSNQAIDYWREGVIVWEDLRFRSSEELAIAQALNAAGALFLPNSKARVGAVGKRKSIEADFVVYHKKRLGILEIDGGQHSGYLAKDQDQDRYFVINGVSTVQRYTAKRCREDAEGVVAEFLRILETQ